QHPESSGEMAPGNWGELPGRSVKGAHNLRFRARGEKGTEVIEFLVGGINRPPYNVANRPYQDGFGPVRQVIQLTDQWRDYVLSLPEDTPLDGIIGGFGFTISRIYNPGPEATVFYLDDISYDNADPDLLRLPRSFVAATDGHSRLRISRYSIDL